MKPGAGGLKANTRDDVSKRGYGKSPPKKPGQSGDNPKGNKPSPFAKKK